MKRHWLISLLLFIWLATGYGVIHVLGSLWLVSILQRVWPGDSPYERLQLTEDGEALVQFWSKSGEPVFRRLDGTIVEQTIGMGRKFIQNNLWLSDRKRGEPRDWSDRVTSFYDFRRPSGGWFLIAPPSYAKHAYFCGFDTRTRRSIGYIGLNGFSQSVPTIDQSFPIETSEFSAFHQIQSSALNPSGYKTLNEYGEWTEQNFVPLSNAEPDTVWLLSKNTIYEIHLGTRQVRPLVENHPEIRGIVGLRDQQDAKSQLRLLDKVDSQLLIIDPKTAKIDSLDLEAQSPNLPHAYFELARLKSGQKVVIANSSETRHGLVTTHNRILWLEEDNSIERSADVDTHSASGRVTPAAISLIAPFPLASGVMCVALPIVLPRVAAEFSGSSGSLQEVCGDYRFWLASSLIIGLIAAWASWRRERDVFKTNNLMWPTVIFAGGFFGWMAYICLKPLPARLPDKRWLPEKPEPARPIGTEIFA